MTEQLQHDELTAGSRRGVRIDVEGLFRQVRLRNRDQLTLLDDVSLAVTEGELVAIVGPSGAGKTTLLEAIAGVAPASTGAVRFDGADLYGNLNALGVTLRLEFSPQIVRKSFTNGRR